MSRREVDLLVIGLGPGGASAARTGAEAGLSVLGVEKNRVLGEPVQCAEFIPLPMRGYARDEGVLLQEITGMKSFLPSGTTEESEFPGLMIDRAAFDRAIARQAEAAGAILQTRMAIKALDPDAHQATIVCDGASETVSYRVLVAADGPHSPVAGLLGLPRLETVNTRQYTVPLLKPYFDTDIWLSDEYPGGYAWLFPKGNLANLGLGADRRFEDNLKTPLDRLHQQLVEAGLVGEEILYRTGGAIPVGGLRERLYEGDVLFVGDAAGLTHPITGAGIAAAVVSGERAGQAAAAWLAGDADAFEDFEEDVRDQYEASVQRGVERREYLKTIWRTQAANEDHPMRRGWIAFDEYFKELAS
ncbi:MAG: geranylgeranyl reductase family protein [Gammaproteobacteria bacterium]